MAYTTEAKVEQYLQITIDDSISGYVNEWIGWASAYIDKYTGTDFEGEIEARYFDGAGGSTMFIDDLVSATSVQFLDTDGDVDYTLVENDDFWFYPLNEETKIEIRLNHFGGFMSFPIGLRRIKITGTWGVASTVPPDIEWVATKLVADIIRQCSDAGKSIQAETLGEYSVTFSNITSNLTPEVKEILNMYRVPNV